MYSVELKSQPQKFIRRLSKNIRDQILDKIETLKTDPVPASSTRLRADPNLRRVRTGDYRIIYHVQEARRHVIITKVGLRRDVYDSI